MKRLKVLQGIIDANKESLFFQSVCQMTGKLGHFREDRETVIGKGYTR